MNGCFLCQICKHQQPECSVKVEFWNFTTQNTTTETTECCEECKARFERNLFDNLSTWKMYEVKVL